MHALYTLYSDPESAERAVDSLRAGAPELGIDEGDIVVETSEPFDERAFGRFDTGTWMPWLAAFGGLAGGAASYWFVAWTQKAYPLATGGMPLAANWTNGIITYEVAMLGAIVATVFTWLVSARLPSLGRKLYDPEVSNGKILVGVVNPPQRTRAELEGRLREAGAEEIRVFPSPRS